MSRMLEPVRCRGLRQAGVPLKRELQGIASMLCAVRGASAPMRVRGAVAGLSVRLLAWWDLERNRRRNPLLER